MSGPRGARALALPLLLWLPLLGATASAGPVPTEKELTQRARMHFQSGSAYYADGQYAAAIREFEASWELAPLPTILFNLAQAHRLGGELETARRYYQRFLGTSPRGPVAEETRRQLTAIQEELGRREAARVEAERAAAARVEAARVEAERAAAARAESERLAREQEEAERQRRVQLEEEQLAAARLTRERAVAEAERARLALAAQPRPTPVYRRWWPWTLVGAGAAGALGLGLGFGLQPAPHAPTAATDLGTAHPF